MKKILFLLAPFFAAAAAAQSPAALTSEPHHHLKLENDFVRVFYMEVAPQQSTLLHQHDNPYVYVVLGSARFTNKALDKKPVDVALKDGQIRYSAENPVHVATNPMETPFRNVTIEFLKPQGEAKNLCEIVVEHKPLNCPPGGAVHATKPAAGQSTSVPEFETEEVKASLVRLGDKAQAAIAADAPDTLIVALENSALKVTQQGKPATLRPGGVAWIARGSEATISNTGQSIARYLAIEFK
ncbi:MAG: hypothetical protein ACRD4K_16640 [Candidatus Acidiferrales bacterium]